MPRLYDYTFPVGQALPFREIAEHTPTGRIRTRLADEDWQRHVSNVQGMLNSIRRKESSSAMNVPITYFSMSSDTHIHALMRHHILIGGRRSGKTMMWSRWMREAWEGTRRDSLYIRTRFQLGQWVHEHHFGPRNPDRKLKVHHVYSPPFLKRMDGKPGWHGMIHWKWEPAPSGGHLLKIVRDDFQPISIWEGS